jgi:hypothetical protein
MQQKRSNEQCADYTIINNRTLNCSHETVRIKMNLRDFNDQLSWMGNYLYILRPETTREGSASILLLF